MKTNTKVMINFKTIRKNWQEAKVNKDDDLDQLDYKRHFQLAVINLEQNLIEERIPELAKTA